MLNSTVNSMTGHRKVFVIGANKTGTTSLKHALAELGFIIGQQKQAELLLDDWSAKKYNSIIKYCKSAEAFQDIPFSLPDTYKVLDKEFPHSKFILTIRNNSNQWYHSLLNFHSQLVGKSTPPSPEDLRGFKYIYKGSLLYAQNLIYKTPINKPYHKETLIKHYEKHNQSVLNYFKNRPNDLLILNLEQTNCYPKLCKFLNLDIIDKTFPHINKSKP